MNSLSNSYTGSNVPSKFVKAIAESVGVPYLEHSTLNFISENVTYWLTILLQDSDKYARHQKRTFITPQDFSKALLFRNFEALYGLSNSEHLLFKNIISNNKEIYFIDEVSTETDLSSVALSHLPKLPVETSLKAHWLSIEGVQPLIPENVLPESNDIINMAKLQNANVQKNTHPPNVKDGKSTITKRRYKNAARFSKNDIGGLTESELNDIAPISMEQQLYYKDVTEACVGSDEVRRVQAFQSLATDPGLHSLLPRFAWFISRGVKINLLQRNLAVLIYLMRMVRALLENPHLLNTNLTSSQSYDSPITQTDPSSSKTSRIPNNLSTSKSSLHSNTNSSTQRNNAPTSNKDTSKTSNTKLRRYAHALIPAVLSCAYCDTMCQRPEVDNHWALRDFSARQLAQFCRTLDNSTNSLQTRICRLSTHIINKYLSNSSQFSSSSNHSTAQKLPISKVESNSNSNISIGSKIDVMPTPNTNDGDSMHIVEDSTTALAEQPPDELHYPSFEVDFTAIQETIYDGIVASDTHTFVQQLPSLASLYGALSCLLELGPLVLNLFAPPAKLKDLDIALTARKISIEQHQQSSRIMPGSVQPLQPQKLMAERVAIEHIKQILAKAGTMLYKHNAALQESKKSSSATNKSANPLYTTTTVDIENLKELYGAGLASAVYAQLKRASTLNATTGTVNVANQQRSTQILPRPFLQGTTSLRPPYPSGNHAALLSNYNLKNPSAGNYSVKQEFRPTLNQNFQLLNSTHQQNRIQQKMPAGVLQQGLFTGAHSQILSQNNAANMFNQQLSSTHQLQNHNVPGAYNATNRVINMHQQTNNNASMYHHTSNLANINPSLQHSKPSNYLATHQLGPGRGGTLRLTGSNPNLHNLQQQQQMHQQFNNPPNSPQPHLQQTNIINTVNRNLTTSTVDYPSFNHGQQQNKPFASHSDYIKQFITENTGGSNSGNDLNAVSNVQLGSQHYSDRRNVNSPLMSNNNNALNKLHMNNNGNNNNNQYRHANYTNTVQPQKGMGVGGGIDNNDSDVECVMEIEPNKKIHTVH